MSSQTDQSRCGQPCRMSHAAPCAATIATGQTAKRPKSDVIITTKGAAAMNWESCAKSGE
jgi:hypothetical protein